MPSEVTFGSLFAGIGGFDLGFERAGMKCKWQVEIDDYATRVLEKHWPDVRRWRDVRTFPPEPIDDWRIDVICGGFPCQDISYAGKGAGIHGERSGLWSEFARTIGILRPRFVLIENVAALVIRGLDVILGTLADLRYDAEWDTLSACMCGAPHMRRRMFVMAYPEGIVGREGIWGKHRHQRTIWSPSFRADRASWLETIANLDGRTDRSPASVDQLRCLGNAVVPQVAEWIGRRIVERADQCQAR